MILANPDHMSGNSRIPRESGDDPWVSVKKQAVGGYSPRERG